MGCTSFLYYVLMVVNLYFAIQFSLITYQSLDSEMWRPAKLGNDSSQPTTTPIPEPTTTTTMQTPTASIGSLDVTTTTPIPTTTMTTTTTTATASPSSTTSTTTPTMSTTTGPMEPPFPIPPPPPPPLPSQTVKQMAFTLVALILGAYGLVRQDAILILLSTILYFVLQIYLLGSLMLVQGLLWIVMYSNDRKNKEHHDDWRDGIVIPPGSQVYWVWGPLVRVW